MHIAILTTSYPLGRDSSSGIFISRLVEALPAGLKRTVITPCPNHPMNISNSHAAEVRCFRYAPVRWQLIAHQPGGIPLALRNNKGLLFLFPWMLLKMLIACIRTGRDADLIHANWSLNGLIAGLAGKLTNTPVVTTLRGSDLERLGTSLTQRIILNGCLRLSNKLVTVSNAINNQVRRHYPEYNGKLVCIPNGVGSEFLGLSEEAGKDPDKLVVTSIGSLIPRKDMETVIRACAELKSDRPVHLVIIGDGPELEQLEQVANRLSGRNITVSFTGNLAPGEIPAQLVKTDIFVLASRHEGRPNVILEAMAAGLPVVASDIDGVREIIQNGINGYLFDAGNPAALAERMRKLANDPSHRRQAGKAARQFILDNNLTWEHCAESYMTLYRTCQNTATAGG